MGLGEASWRKTPPPGVEASPPVEQHARLAAREAIAPHFDRAYYLEMQADVDAAGVDPLDHFVDIGWREARDPTRWFSVADYLDMHPDVAAANVNPFYHYLTSGKSEGRPPRSETGFRYRILAQSRTVTDRLASATRESEAVEASPVSKLREAFESMHLAGAHITFSHDDFTSHRGGIQSCLWRESAAAKASQRHHLHFHPATHWPAVRTSCEASLLGVVIDGAHVGAYCHTTILQVLATAPARDNISFAIHSMLGHETGEVVSILRAFGVRSGYFWLHDFASLCAGFHLLRNDVQDCGAPPSDSAACGICHYAALRPRHQSAHRDLFDLLDLTVVSPSDSALRLWSDRTNLPRKGEIVHPHAWLAPQGEGWLPQNGPLKVGYAGFPSDHKGFPVFVDLAATHTDDPRYSFFHLGAKRVRGLAAQFVHVSTTPDDPLSMRRALEEHLIDVVLIWPLCRETFSLVAYEAVASGAAVVTWKDSGNVADFVAQGGHGLVLESETRLGELFTSGSATALGRIARRPRVSELVFSDLTLDLIPGAKRAAY